MLADGDIHYLGASGPSTFGIYGLLRYTSEYITSNFPKLACIFHMDRRPQEELVNIQFVFPQTHESEGACYFFEVSFHQRLKECHIM